MRKILTCVNHEFWLWRENVLLSLNPSPASSQLYNCQRKKLGQSSLDSVLRFALPKILYTGKKKKDKYCYYLPKSQFLQRKV